MKIRNSKDALLFFLSEKKKTQFLVNELGIIMLMLSCLLWLIFFYLGYQFLFFTIAIQISLLFIGFKMISTEKDRQTEAEYMVHKIYKENEKRGIYYQKRFERLFRKYFSKGEYFADNPRRQVEVILEELNSQRLDKNEKAELIDMLNYFLYEYYVE
ncbi:hypothetical protein U6A24_02905 [Aquimarina gracilis]|uniref:Uncharacterized protein n=1 Tax=Aquimarina gracilis TaxID=874422 RepID=A0ABU5ZQN8_9FLAO|nr:hypothetical protein [Aquimarina gracilis]MEB3344390.1 hypothetical protein [Aquimarina gracilis]